MTPCPYNLDDPCPDDQLRDQLLALQAAGRGYQQQIERLEAQLAEARLDLGNWAAAAGNEKARADRLQGYLNAGWTTFGAHALTPGIPLEFSEATGEDGLPLYERPTTHPSAATHHHEPLTPTYLARLRHHAEDQAERDPGWWLESWLVLGDDMTPSRARWIAETGPETILALLDALGATSWPVCEGCGHRHSPGVRCGALYATWDGQAWVTADDNVCPCEK